MPSDRSASARRGIALMSGLLLCLACGVIGFYELFSTFLPYDDEGLMMLSNQLFLEGYQPYSEITWLYGPAQLAWVQLLHGVAAIPITHNAVRLITLAVWLSVAAISGAVALRLTGSRVWAAIAFLLSFLFTRSIVNEPGHPQGILTVAVLAIPLISALNGGNRQWWTGFVLGSIVAVTAAIKPNAGVFNLAAVGVAVLGQVGSCRWHRLLTGIVVVGSMVFPLLLMYPLLSHVDCLRFALISGFSTAAVAITACTARVPGADFPALARGVLSGLAVTSIAALGYVLVLGISPADIIVSLLGYAARQLDFYHFFRAYLPVQVALGAASLLCAVAVMLCRHRATVQGLLVAAKGWFVLAAFYSLAVNDPAHAQAMLGWAGPWCWSVVILDRSSQASMARLLLAAIAAWSPLLAYPVPGSQLYFGSLPVLLAALVCLADLVPQAMNWMARRSLMQRGETGLLRVIQSGVLFLTLVLLYGQFETARTRYTSNPLLGLPDTGYLRMEGRSADHFRELVAVADQHDLVLTTFRFNSLYFWTSADFPGAQYLSQFTLEYSSDAQQAAARQALQQARRPLVIDRMDLRKARVKGGLYWLDEEFETFRRIGPYLLLRPRKDGEGAV